ncbi:hypothetical protein [Halalkalicoccus tibetensis]|uniref:PH domain-containing protein n=1 Tax=Halalkalicoccus tibetensis TaxID=175632 RepID=A0ABD5V2H9_9EURY
MVRTPGWVAVSAGAYLVALSLLVLLLDGVALTGPLARRARTYRLLENGVIRQDSGALVSTFVPGSRITVAERDGELIRFERRGPWWPETAFVVDEGGDREATARWFDVGTGNPY